MRSNRDKALDMLAEHLQNVFGLKKLFEPQVKKDENMMNARQMFMYIAIELRFKETYKELREFMKENYGMTYSLRAVIYSATAFADKIADSISLSSKHLAAKEYVRSVYVKPR